MNIEYYTEPSTINEITYRRPYLNFKEKLSQILVNPYSVILGLFVVKLLFFLNSLVDSLDQGRIRTHLLYGVIQTYGNDLVSFPHYMAKISNLIISKSMLAANKGLIDSLKMVMTASQNIIYFAIDLSVGTYACLLTAAVDDTAIAALNATESIIHIANETLILFATDLNDGLKDLTKLINDVIDTADDTADAIKHMFGDDTSSNTTSIEEKVQHVNLTIQNMKKWEISPTINIKIEKLKQEVPNFEQVSNYTKTIIDAPFKELKNQVDRHLNQSFDAGKMYVPGIKELDFTNGTTQIDDFFNESVKIARFLTHIIVGLIAILILLFILYETYIELRDWRRVKIASNHIILANKASPSGKNQEKYNIEVIKSIQDRRADFIGSILTNKLLRLKNPTHINNVKWMINYVASSFLLPFFLLGILGISLAVFQLIILSALKKIDFSITSSKMFEHTREEIYNSFNASLNTWTNETNTYLLEYQDHVNNNIFSWIDTAAVSINNTVGEFDKRMNDALDDIFKGTPLYTPIEQVVGCVIENKLKRIEKAMDWLVDNAYMTLPELDPKNILEEMLAIKAQKQEDSLSSHVEEFKKDAKTIFHEISVFYHNECYTTLKISSSILAIWFFFVLIGLVILTIREKKLMQKYGSSQPNEKYSRSCIRDSLPNLETRDTSNFEVFSNIIHNLRDKYLYTKNGYMRTPTEPYNVSAEYTEHKRVDTLGLDTSSGINRDDNCTRAQFEFTPNSEETPDHDEKLYDIGENDTSLSNAKQWTP